MTLFNILLQTKQVHREDFYTLWILAQQQKTEQELTSILAASLRTVQRSLARLKKAGLAIKTDRITGTWGVTNKVTTNLTLQTNNITHNTNYPPSGQDNTQTLQSTQCSNSLVTLPAVTTKMANDTTQADVKTGGRAEEMAKLACQLLNLPFSSRIAMQLGKIPNVTEEIITEAAAVTLREVLQRKPGYAPIKNPVGYFLMVVSRKCQQCDEVTAIKQKAQAQHALKQVASTRSNQESPETHEAKLLTEIKTRLQSHVVYFNPTWDKNMLNVLQQTLPSVSEAEVLALIDDQLSKKPNIAIELATKPWLLGSWINQHQAIKQKKTVQEMDFFTQEALVLLLSRCRELSITEDTKAVHKCAVAIGNFLSRNPQQYTATYIRINNAKPEDIVSWLTEPNTFTEKTPPFTFGAGDDGLPVMTLIS